MNLLDFYSLNPTEFSSAVILFNLFFAFALELVIVFAYKKTRHGLSHSRSFVFSLVITGILSAAIMMAVQNNIIGAFAVFAAFTMIRFRSILKEPSDLAFLFFALVIGISSGMSHYSLAFITVVFLSGVIFLINRFGFSSVSDNFDYVLLLSTTNEFAPETLDNILEGKVAHRELLHIKQYENGTNEYSHSLRLKEGVVAEKLAKILQQEKSVVQVEFLTGKSTSEF